MENRSGIVGFKLRIVALICLVSLLALTAIFADNSRAAPRPGLFWLNPADPVAYAGDFTMVTFQMDNISNVFAAGINVEYDSTILSIVDAAGTPSSTIIPGSCPAPDFVVVNSATGGTITYIVSQLPNITPTPCNGGVMATVYFRCADTVTTETKSPITVSSSEISDPDGGLINHSIQNAEITCKPKVFIYLPAIFK